MLLRGQGREVNFVTVVCSSNSLTLSLLFSLKFSWQLISAPQAKTLQTPPDTRFPPLQGKDEGVLHLLFT